MSSLSRRNFALGALAGTGLVAGCGATGIGGNGMGGNGGSIIDARVDETLNFMYSRFPATQELANNAAGMLVMPVITEVGLWYGGSYGRGALRVGDVSVDYYSAASASAGFQVGVQQFSHVLFFMTNDALMNFRHSSGWSAGADLEYVLNDQGENVGAATLTSLAPVLAVVFAQAGFRVGATLEGTKYSRIIP